MKLPMGLRTKGYNKKTHFLQLLNNIYGHNQAGRVCNQCLFQGLFNIDFRQLGIDERLFDQGGVIFFPYIYVRCFLVPSSKLVEISISYFKDVGKCRCHFDLEYCGDILDYLGINISKTKDGNLKLTEPKLIN